MVFIDRLRRSRRLTSLVPMFPLLILAACVESNNGAPSAQRGRAIADLWCSECHRVAPDQPSGARPGHTLPPAVPGPSFMAVAARPYADAEYLAGFMSELHVPMPIFRLSRAEKSDLVAYILSLKGSGSARAP
jgi:mono/diheme cytochrome c family protein